jgi:Mn2+/Fe2+ NRAMP family transporter
VELIFTRKELVLCTKIRAFYVLFLLIISTGSLIVIFQFSDNLKELVDFATTLSFVIAPIIAIFNYKLVTGNFLDIESQPSIYLKVLSVGGIVFLIGFAIVFIVTRFYNF